MCERTRTVYKDNNYEESLVSKRTVFNLGYNEEDFF